MRHAWLAALAVLLLLPVPAEARTRCRPTPDQSAETVGDAAARWPHDATSDWVHDGDDAWVHEHASGRWVHEEAGYDPDEGAGWVHDTDYGWWAAVPDADLSDLTGEDDDEPEAPGVATEDCERDRGRNECRVMWNQLATYRFRMELAKERGDARWEASLLTMIERLEKRGQLYSCPWREPTLREKIDQTVEAVTKAAVVAARVAAMLYRMGLF